ncbi:MAG: tRNA preQ1(34) S-adenosylmethionine ribosyltransferase-isomerase QueA [Deltaproteobacteria bacterium]|nr:MAG: tRNA preQ1(34) S-adenosylmethionine ribosyltransferase-isomerase QueA [Deltaproteobacteria bacterium]
MFDIETYDYDLPPHLIAQYPAPERDKSRLLVVERTSGQLRDQHFGDLPGFLKRGDVLVLNDTRVVPARLLAVKETGGRVELFVLEGIREGEEECVESWCLYRASKRARVGMKLFIAPSVYAEIVELGKEGFIRVRFSGAVCVREILEKWGHVPLPPYIRREARSEVDRERYQTVFSKRNGAVAAPTAGLHFTERLLEKLKESGVRIASLTLHVGYGTFQPVRTKDIRKHRLEAEYFNVSPSTAEMINACKKNGGRVVAVGTTVVRALESAVSSQGKLSAVEEKTDLLITPGFRFKLIDALITNFHLPKSSLLFLVVAFAGLDLVKKAYAHAIDEEYRFYSYGDAMLIL